MGGNIHWLNFFCFVPVLGSVGTAVVSVVIMFFISVIIDTIYIMDSLSITTCVIYQYCHYLYDYDYCLSIA